MSIVLDNGKVSVEFDDDYGRIVRASHAGLGIEVVTEPRLAENFRLLIPLPSRRGHGIRDFEADPGCAQSRAELRLSDTAFRG